MRSTPGGCSCALLACLIWSWLSKRESHEDDLAVATDAAAGAGRTERVLLEAIDYLVAESRVLRKRYEQDCGKRLLLSDQQRWELAARARPVVKSGYAHVIGIFRPDTLMRWYRRLVASKFDSSRVPQRQGRPEIPRTSRSSSCASPGRIAGGATTGSSGPLPTWDTTYPTKPLPTC